MVRRVDIKAILVNPEDRAKLIKRAKDFICAVENINQEAVKHILRPFRAVTYCGLECEDAGIWHGSPSEPLCAECKALAAGDNTGKYVSTKGT